MFKNTLKTLSCLLILSIAFAAIPGKDYKFNFYELQNIQPNSDKSQWVGSLVYQGSEVEYGSGNAIIKNLKFTLTFQEKYQLQIKIEDADNSLRWQIPENDIFPYTPTDKTATREDSSVEVTWKNSPFGFTITRKSSKEIIFDTTVDTFIFSDYYLEVSTSIPTSNIYGLGERTSKLNLGAGTYSLWNADPTKKTDAGAGQNSYGSHPVYLVKETDGKDNWSVIHLRNSNAMSVELNDAKKVTYRVTGGIIDFNFFIGSPLSAQPEGVISHYHTYLGGWTLPPFWSFGYHQSKTGYNNLKTLTDVVNTYNKNELPFDAIWSDVDYMDNFKTFTVAEDKFKAEDFNKLLSQNKKRWVPLIESGITKDSDFYKQATLKNVFITKGNNNAEFVGKVGTSDCVWMDWFHSDAPEQWKQGLKSLRDKVQFTGLWLNRNEVSNAETEDIGDNKDIINNLPYTPTGSPLNTNTISLDAKHRNGKTEFNAHNLFSFMESHYTFKYLEESADVPIPFILSRSTAPGSGRYAAHWNGDIPATWESLQNSLTSIMNFNLYGIPMTGSDICGTKKDTTEELCTRWMQLGALYPFARSHAEKEAASHEPWALGENVLKTSRVHLQLRYSLLKHFYGLFLDKLQVTSSGSTKRLGSGTIFRPLFFEFVEDALLDSKNKYAETELLIGSSLLVAPVLEQGATERDVYFPVDTWFNFFTGKKIISQSEANRVLKVKAPLNSTIPMFLRAGAIVPIQNTRGVLTAEDLDAVFELVVALSADNLAKGTIFGVDDEGALNVKKKCVTQNCLVNTNVEVITGGNHLNVTITFKQSDSYELVMLSGLRIYGIAIGNNLFTSEFLTIYKGGKDFTFVEAADGALKIRFLTPRILMFSETEKEVSWTYTIPITNSKLITQ